MRQRVITSMILIPIVLGLVFARSPFPVLTLASACVYFGLDELYTMLFRKKSSFASIATVLFAFIGYFVLTEKLDRIITAGSLTVGFGVSIAALLLLLKQKRSPKLMIPASIWVMAPFMGLLLLHKSGPANQLFFPNAILMALIPVWVGDSVAIFFGKKYGKYALWPALSPKKTWEGAKASTVSAIISSGILSQLLHINIGVGLL